MACAFPLCRSRLNQGCIHIGTPVTVKLPEITHLTNLVKVQVRGDKGILIARADSQKLAAWAYKVALAIKLSDVPRLLVSNTIDSAKEIAVGYCMGRLLQFPEVLRKAGNRGGWIENYLGAVQPKGAGALREVPVVADIDAHLAVLGLKNGIS